jgi:hypothetical protein
MRRIAFALLSVFLLASFGFPISPAKAGDYDYSGDGYSGGGYYGHRYSDVGYRHRYYDDGYYRRHRSVWYTSSCCYRKVVRHTRSVRYERLYDDHSYYRRPYYRSYYYGRPYRYDSGYYHRPYYHRYDSGYYGYSGRPYYRASYSDYVYRPYRHYNLGYDYARYDRCGRIPLADGRGGWVWSRRAGCF